MHKLIEHHQQYHNSAKHNELEDLAHSTDMHDCYYKFRKLSGGAFLHMKDRSKQHFGNNHLYHSYPNIVFFEPHENEVLKKFADPTQTHHHLLDHLEKSNAVSGGSWKAFKKVAMGAMKVYHKINNAVGSVADFAKKIPIDDPKYQAVVGALSTGTKLHDGILTAVGAGF